MMVAAYLAVFFGILSGFAAAKQNNFALTIYVICFNVWAAAAWIAYQP